MSDDRVRVIVDDDVAQDVDNTSLQARPSFEEAVRRTLVTSISLKLDGLTAQLTETYEKVAAAIAELPQESHGCRLQTVSFTLTVSSSGEVSLLSAVSGKLEGQAGLQFTIQKVS